MGAVAGAGDKVTLVVWREFGLWHIVAGDEEVTGHTLEKAIDKLAVDAPPEYTAHAAAVLEGILGVGEPAR